MIVVTLIGIYLALLFILNYMFRLSVSSSDSANAHLPGCFRPWIFHLNIGLNMLPSDSFVSCLDYLLGYSTGAGLICNWLSLRCLVPWINHLPPVYWSTFWKSSLKWRWVCKFDTLENNFFIFFNTFYIYLNASQYDKTFLYLFLLKPYFHISNSVLFLYSIFILHICSLDTFYSLTKLGRYVQTSHNCFLKWGHVYLWNSSS